VEDRLAGPRPERLGGALAGRAAVGSARRCCSRGPSQRRTPRMQQAHGVPLEADPRGACDVSLVGPARHIVGASYVRSDNVACPCARPLCLVCLPACELPGRHSAALTPLLCRPGPGAANAQAELRCAARLTPSTVSDVGSVRRCLSRRGRDGAACTAQADRPAGRDQPRHDHGVLQGPGSETGDPTFLTLVRAEPGTPFYAVAPAGVRGRMRTGRLPRGCGARRGRATNRAPRVRRPCARGAKHCRRPRPSLFHRAPQPPRRGT
jgi:hypothetical protein